MAAPLVSVILPTHNRANVLGRAIRSVLAQTFPRLELIVVDDGSTDETADVVADFDDSRIRYLKTEQSNGAAAARNLGVHSSNASLLAFQDSDDEWLVDKLRIQVAAMQQAQGKSALVCGGYIVLPQAGRACYVGAEARMQKGDWGADNIYDFCFITPTWLIRRSTLEAVGLFDEQMPNLEDWELSFRLYRHGAGIIALDQPLVLKHGGADSLNWEPTNRIASLQIIIERHAEIWQQHPQVLARLHDELGRLYCRMGQMREGRVAFRRAVKLAPGIVTGWILLGTSCLGHRGYSGLRNSMARGRDA